MTRFEDCEQCDGHGWVRGAGTHATCPTCCGAGKVEVWVDEPETEDQPDAG